MKRIPYILALAALLVGCRPDVDVESSLFMSSRTHNYDGIPIEAFEVINSECDTIARLIHGDVITPFNIYVIPRAGGHITLIVPDSYRDRITEETEKKICFIVSERIYQLEEHFESEKDYLSIKPLEEIYPGFDKAYIKHLKNLEQAAGGNG